MDKIRAKKENMTQIFAENGEVFAVTLLKLVDAKGQTLSTDSQGLTLKEGDVVTVSGITKGKGFQGVIKRHGFKGGRRSHGQKHSEREAGSIGGGGRAGGRVAKGMRMAGRMGGSKTSVKNLRVVKVLPETGEVFISGAVPGRRGTKLEIKNQ